MRPKGVLLGFATLLLLSSLGAGKEEKEICEPLKFEYEQKLRTVKEEAYKKGWEDAMEYVKRRLKELERDFYALEVGKYLMRKNLVTAPRVYKYINENGETVIKVLGCRVEDVRQLSKIFEEGIYIPTCEDAKEVPRRTVRTSTGIVFKKTFPKTRRVKEVLDMLNIAYEITPNGYQVVFSSTEEYESFCRATKVCGD